MPRDTKAVNPQTGIPRLRRISRFVAGHVSVRSLGRRDHAVLVEQTGMLLLGQQALCESLHGRVYPVTSGDACLLRRQGPTGRTISAPAVPDVPASGMKIGSGRVRTAAAETRGVFAMGAIPFGEPATRGRPRNA